MTWGLSSGCARAQSAAFIEERLGEAMLLEDRYALLDFALAKAQAQAPGGLVCEFGVAGGKTLRFLAQRAPAAHGFDSFEGLPEDWTGAGERAGRFSRQGKLPQVPANVRLHKGWFDATLPPFLAANAGHAMLLHLDADLYSSTKTVLTLMAERIVPGTVLVFDEYLNYPGWRSHEHRALSEFLAETNRTARYIGFSTLQGQAAVQIAAA